MFESAEHKLDRARHHYGILQDVLDEWRPGAVELDWTTAYNGRHRVIAKVVRPAPQAATGALEDTLHNARAALDRLVYEVAGTGGRRCSFPVPDDQTKWAKRLQDAVPGQEAGWLRDHLRSLEPWPGGTDTWIHRLHHLNIADKHHSGFTVVAGEASRTVTTVGQAVHPDPWSRAEPTYVAELEVTYTMPDPICPLRPGNLIAEFTPEEYSEIVSFKLAAYLAFGPAGGAEGVPVIRWSQGMLRRVTALLASARAAAP